MLADAELPDIYWWDALQYEALLHNVSPTHALEDCAPEEDWSGNKPDVSRLSHFRLSCLRAYPGQDAR